MLITGASRGIGQAVAQHLTTLGAKITISARSQMGCDAVAAEIIDHGGQAFAQICNVADWAQVSTLVEKATTAFGPVDILVNNAGLIDPIARLEDSDPAAWGQVVDVNLKGAYHMIRMVLPDMIARKDGTIINISSGAATGALEGWSHYCSTKAGLLSLTRCVHREQVENGIRCVGLSPGTVATQMQRDIASSGINPVSKIDWSDHIPPEWVARAVAWLTTQPAREFDGTDFSLKTNEGREAVGLPTL